MLTIVGWAALLVIFVLIAGSLYFYQKAIARASKDFLKEDPELETSSEEAAASDANGRWWRSQSFQKWEIVSDDGLRLRGFYLPAARATNKTAIIAHGYSGNATLMGGWAKLYAEELGYNILLPDARGHGASEGRYIGFGWHERKDFVRWIKQVIEVCGDDVQIVLHGISMGGATVMMTSGERLPANVKAIVEDCGYTSVKEELSHQLRRMYRLPAFPILSLTSLVTKLRAGYYFGEASALAQVKKTRTPMLFIHGDADAFVPTEMVYRLYESCPTDKQLYVVAGAAHGNARLADQEGYARQISGFIGKYVI
ncbi:hypothetical protein FHS18_002885 [Paenibacillus phyllosphaerae]|uniref:AB hydrolase-1 domain-containing protein n=1 Tax=Paenibacillus phyllosphaerae TaxID=274593 RepID=A0A7W5FN51_9BACL|nr:alpha/beta hydrolase [Paenibacillus phyllosphaerae]MBB3110818.1 hypothetical protein [Paenibacillus phyllosphaerae]